MALQTEQPFEELAFCTDGISTKSSNDQEETERDVEEYLSPAKFDRSVYESVKLRRSAHIEYLRSGLHYLPAGFECLDASRPWMIYWIVHSLELLGKELTSQEKDSVINTLSRCQCPEGGFGGGIGQMAHLAPTYAAVNALAIVGTEDAFNLINRTNLQSWVASLRTSEGAFRMHEDGEIDIRGAYCAVSILKLVKAYDSSIFEGTVDWLSRCQTYEGGLSAIPYTEAHGGYAFCGLAAIVLLEGVDKIDVDALLDWSVKRQMRSEGGFQGRTHKLVDGCYSFWVGGVFPLLKEIYRKQGRNMEPSFFLYDEKALQDYILFACQKPGGGLCDKPSKHRDFYHTCYTLSGLSSAQHFGFEKPSDGTSVVGAKKNLLCQTHPCFNVCLDKVEKIHAFFEPL